MNETSPDALRQAVGHAHSCLATLSHTVEVHERFGNDLAWHGTVSVFNLSDHRSATVCFAWTSPIADQERVPFPAEFGPNFSEVSNVCKYFSILQLPPVSSAEEAVRFVVENNGIGARFICRVSTGAVDDGD